MIVRKDSEGKLVGEPKYSWGDTDGYPLRLEPIVTLSILECGFTC